MQCKELQASCRVYLEITHRCKCSPTYILFRVGGLTRQPIQICLSATFSVFCDIREDLQVLSSLPCIAKREGQRALSEGVSTQISRDPCPPIWVDRNCFVGHERDGRSGSPRSGGAELRRGSDKRRQHLLTASAHYADWMVSTPQIINGMANELYYCR